MRLPTKIELKRLQNLMHYLFYGVRKALLHLLLNFKFRLKLSGTDNYIYFYTVYERNVTWNRNYHMLYIDNPVGTGFSFTNSSDGLSTTEDEVADNLYKYLEAILFLFIFCPFSFSLLSSSSFVSLYSVYLSSSSLSSQSI